MIKKTKNSVIIKTWLHNILCDLSFMYHPDSKRGKRPQYDEMLKIVHPIVIKEKLQDKNDEEHPIYRFAVSKALRFIEEVSKIDETKKDYYNIYYYEYFKPSEFEKFNAYDISDKYYCSARNVSKIIVECNSLVHKFVIYYVENDSIITKPYYAFSDQDINQIIEKLDI